MRSQPPRRRVRPSSPSLQGADVSPSPLPPSSAKRSKARVAGAAKRKPQHTTNGLFQTSVSSSVRQKRFGGGGSGGYASRRRSGSVLGFLTRLSLLALALLLLIWGCFTLGQTGWQWLSNALSPKAEAEITDTASLEDLSGLGEPTIAWPLLSQVSTSEGLLPLAPVVPHHLKHLYNLPRLYPLPTANLAESLQQRIEAIVASYGTEFKVHLYAYSPSKLEFASINGALPAPAASVIKLPLLALLAKAMERNDLSPNSLLPLTEGTRASGSGEWLGEAAGSTHTLMETATAMIQISDNSATNMVISALGGLENTKDQMALLGLQNSQIRNWLPDLEGQNKLSPEEMVQLLFNIQEGLLLGDEAKQTVLEILVGTKNKRLIVEPLPADVMVAHKTGDIGQSLGDSALVYLPTGEHYYLSIMVERPHNNYRAADMIRELSAAVYQHMRAEVASNMNLPTDETVSTAASL
jgi:beta-lactamase class A